VYVNLSKLVLTDRRHDVGQHLVVQLCPRTQLSQSCSTRTAPISDKLTDFARLEPSGDIAPFRAVRAEQGVLPVPDFPLAGNFFRHQTHLHPINDSPVTNNSGVFRSFLSSRCRHQ
jgi:hypothetical protein